MTKKFKYSQLVLVEFRNTEPFVYMMVSNRKKIAIDAVAKYFIETEGFREDRDGITFIDDPTQIELKN